MIRFSSRIISWSFLTWRLRFRSKVVRASSLETRRWIDSKFTVPDAIFEQSYSATDPLSTVVNYYDHNSYRFVPFVLFPLGPSTRNNHKNTMVGNNKFLNVQCPCELVYIYIYIYIFVLMLMNIGNSSWIRLGMSLRCVPTSYQRLLWITRWLIHMCNIMLYLLSERL